MDVNWYIGEMRLKCVYCGRFIGKGDKVSSALVWTGGAVKEPSHEEWWHDKCAEPEAETKPA